MTWKTRAGVAGAFVVAACAGQAATRAPGSAPTATGAAGVAPTATGAPSAAPDALGATPSAPAPAASSRIQCPEGRGDCDENPANGCETDVGDDPENCRFCGRSCATHDGATVGCFQSMCHIIACPRGKCDLDGRADTGCEGRIVEGHCTATEAPHYDF